VTSGYGLVVSPSVHSRLAVREKGKPTEIQELAVRLNFADQPAKVALQKRDALYDRVLQRRWRNRSCCAAKENLLDAQ
jgi:hypothetical protein